MEEKQTKEMAAEGEATSDHDAMDSDVQIEESSTPVIVLDDEETPMPVTSAATECPPLLTIQFSNSELYRTMLRDISAAIQTVFRTHSPAECVAVRPDPDRCTLGVFKAETTVATDSTDSLFVVDSTPTKDKKNDGPIPSYKKVMSKVYEGQTPESASNSMARRARAKQTCWNCEGDHGLKDCKQPRNYNRIRQKKEEFQRKTERYHAEMEQKYGHIKPGRFSAQLRDALGLGSRDMPLCIYMMRKYGYPPGWLEDAKITHSGIQLFDSNGDAVQHSDDSDGEADNGRSKYDVRKIIAFPGFNEPLEGKMFDDHKYYNVPPYSEEQSREQMIRQLEGTLVHGYRRKKLKLSMEESGCANIVDTTANMELVDMEEEEGSPQPEPPHPEPPQQEPSQPEPPKPEPPQPEPPRTELAPPELPQTNSLRPEREELEEGELSDEDESEKLADDCTEESVILIENPIEVITLDDTIVTDPPAPSPTIDDLHKRQQKLIEQLTNQPAEDTNFNEVSLEDISSSTLLLDNTMHTPAPPGFSSPAPPPPPPENATPPERSAPPPPPEDSEPSTKPPEPETLDLGEIAMNKLPYLDDPGSVGLKKMSLGTPILRAFTPYSSLPSGEAFSKGVSDVINFENLPNSTGKYLQMKSLLTRVRQKISDHMRHMDDER
uniref:PSP proline-rich domain-containing protein n=1 Tax=Anopheles atroparvus TaxID=41427 RepID=A0AAG5D5W0_ANOAO